MGGGPELAGTATQSASAATAPREPAVEGVSKRIPVHPSLAETTHVHHDPQTELPWPDERLMARALAPLRLLSRYCRVTTEGVENVPDGPCILVANHTGWFGLDYTNAVVALNDQRGRLARGLAHPAWFRSPLLAQVAHDLGLAAASKENLLQLLGRGDAVLMFPEGEEAAFKPTLLEPMYRLREFRRGFVRAAMIAGAPIVPVAILGGEEAHPTIGRLNLTRRRFGLPLPIPLTLFPLPVKWRIHFLRPIDMSRYGAADANDHGRVHAVAAKTRRLLARELVRAQRCRGHAFA